MDVDSISYLLPPVDLNKFYDTKDVKRVTGSDPRMFLGRSCRRPVATHWRQL
ncbi:Hypothetical protein CINCED_3A018856 [Cinara cedri]|uniref:Uncharacterized protein n=1 Tax=Cinara cedri TaxID=506608 RepID=A0A5E4N3I5_9HEMI|nr:Hypothetical protein CINCED_3A018856 [Cinara cedri]